MWCHPASSNGNVKLLSYRLEAPTLHPPHSATIINQHGLSVPLCFSTQALKPPSQMSPKKRPGNGVAHLSGLGVIKPYSPEITSPYDLLQSLVSADCRLLLFQEDCHLAQFVDAPNQTPRCRTPSTCPLNRRVRGTRQQEKGSARLVPLQPICLELINKR